MSKKDDFNFAVILDRWQPNFDLPNRNRQIKRIEIAKEDVTDELLERNYIFVANLIKQYGEQYLPIFERLHLEIEHRKKNKAMLETALNVCNKSPPTATTRSRKQSYPDIFS